ncbi:flagellar basal body P-ring formation protein FlgA [Mesobaculum littorinae]|uniref:Flagella basal body P-ring formation protein FlgA n=1 Tax=Mesobaculum littorinae TaxID=2486419 RepID=A0A438AGY9_9RHOB|nr:flagellar basal body P-ring formation chaperone FlgA [Mesobaculum littorinae]RVV97962.1 flagellar basal body P-ring formation protein FlgA [Mesobaculum littorinae]
MRRAALILALWPWPALAETVVAAQTVRPQTMIGPQHLSVVAADTPGTLSDPALAVGQEARVVLYAGRPIRPGDIGPPAIVDRNQIVQLAYSKGPLRIVAEGRALDRAGVGDAVRVMNLGSRSTVTGVVAEDGTIHVAGTLP